MPVSVIVTDGTVADCSKACELITEAMTQMFLPLKYMGYYYWLERYGMIILLVLLGTGIINFVFEPIISFLWNFLPY